MTDNASPHLAVGDLNTVTFSDEEAALMAEALRQIAAEAETESAPPLHPIPRRPPRGARATR